MSNTIDSAYLLELARDRSSQRRQELVSTIADIFSANTKVLSDQERAIMLDILQRLVGDAERTVRKAIADIVATLADAPDALIRFLANDDAEIAYPVLRESRVLGDEDLIEVIRNRTKEHQLAVAVRRGVSRTVTDALVEQGDENVIATLLDNPDADISEATMDYLVSESEKIDSFRAPIVRRNDLDPELAKRMFLWVSAALRKHIVETYQLPRSTVDDLMEQASKRAAERNDGNGIRDAADVLADKLMEKQRGEIVMTMLRALRSGEVSLFEATFRKLTGLNRKMVQRILFEPEAEGLAIAAKSAGIPIEDFVKIYSMTQTAFSKREVVGKRTHRMIKFYQNLSQEAADEVTAQWRRDSGYLSALRSIEERL